MAIDLVVTTEGRHTYNDSPLLMTPLSTGSNTIRGYEDSVVISLPEPIGLIHAVYQEGKEYSKDPLFQIRGPHGSWLATPPAAQACSHQGWLGVRGKWMDSGRYLKQPLFWEAAGVMKRAPTLESGGPGV